MDAMGTWVARFGVLKKDELGKDAKQYDAPKKAEFLASNPCDVMYIYIHVFCSSSRWLIIQPVLVVRKTAMGIRARICYNALVHPNRYTIN
jgi:hypothetical protein